MTGDATFSGTTYQASVIGFIAVHVLTETKLRWLSSMDDTPSAVAGEVRGPGDDARIEFGPGEAPIEVQAKHGLKGPKALKEVLEKMRDAQASETGPIVLAVDSSSSASIRVDFRRDLDRLRSGRTDSLKEITRTTLADLGDAILPLLRRIRILILDVDTLADREAIRAQELLGDNLEDAQQASATWAILQTESARICAEKSRRTRRELLHVLQGAGIRVRPPRRTRRWHDDLRFSKQLLSNDDPAAALSLLRQIELDMRAGAPDGEILYRLNQHKAAAYLQSHDYKQVIHYAQKALEHNATGVHALVNLATAQAFAGQMDEARRTAERIASAHPDEPSAWLARMQVSVLARAEQPDEPPPHVQDTLEYRRGLVQLRLLAGDADGAREISAGLIAQGDRSPETLLSRVDALLVDVDGAPVHERLARAADIERLATEIIDGPADVGDVRFQKALVARSVSRRILGRTDEAQKDIERAHQVRPDDARILIETTQARIQAGDEAGALSLLSRPIVDDNSFLLVMRAGLRNGQGDRDNARKDLDRVLGMIAEADQPHLVRSAAAEVAIELGDLPLAKRLLDEAPASHQSSPHHTLLRARLAVREGDDVRHAESLYREAAALDPAHRTEFLAEYSQRLLQAKHPAEAVRVFQDAQPLPSAARRSYAQALIEVDRLSEASAVVEQAMVGGSPPDWAVAYAAEIAIRRNDPVNAASHLEDLIGRGSAFPANRLTLIETLLRLDQADRAWAHAQVLMTDEELSPHDRMQLAHVLIRLGRPAEGIAAALRAYREAPNDADVNRAFASAVMFSKWSPGEPTEIGANTHAVLRGDDGTQLEYVIFADPAGPMLPNEITVEQATAAQLVGLRVGDTFVQNSQAWFEKRWQVVNVQAAMKYVVNDVISNYPSRFPSEPFFVAGFHVDPDAPSVGDLQPMIAATQDRERHQKRVLDAYRDRVLPLSVVARLMDVTIPTLMQYLIREGDGRVLFVEWADDEGSRIARTAARTATDVVVTRSALFTLQAEQLLETLGDGYRLMGPRSLRDELRSELRDAEERVKDGWNLVAGGPRGLIMHSVEAGDPQLVEQRDRLKALLEWTDARVAYRPRPLEGFGDARTWNSQTRSQLGESASDAVEMGLHEPATLYADDLGLRMLARGFNVSSFSTISMIQVLAERGAIPARQRDAVLVNLVASHYNAAIVSPEMLLEATANTRTADARREVFGLLAGPAMDVERAARVVVRTVKAAVLSAIATTTAGEIVRHALEAMAHRFDVWTATELVARVAEEELVLLPTELRAVKHVCWKFRRKHLP